jgi:hypothetical protein
MISILVAERLQEIVVLQVHEKFMLSEFAVVSFERILAGIVFRVFSFCVVESGAWIVAVISLLFVFIRSVVGISGISCYSCARFLNSIDF